MHIRRNLWLGLLAGTMACSTTEKTELSEGAWFGNLVREDGKVIQFHFDIKKENDKTVLYLINASDKMRIDKVNYTKDSVFFELPVFESSFKAKRVSDKKWEGLWTKAGSRKTQVMPFFAEPQTSVPGKELKPGKADITGRWAVSFATPDETAKYAVGEWQQKGNTLVGTMLTPTGDYRYLHGIVNGDSMQLSTFDGVHAFLFTAKINDDKTLSGGTYYSGPTFSESWEAVKNENATLPDVAAMHLKGKDDKLNFTFRDINGKQVSINDEKFKNKVVVIQIMGSWCPNCMDETAFLSDYYKKNKDRGVEIVGLAYEYTPGQEAFRENMGKFQKRFDVQYTLLNTGVTVSDSLKTEKTLPQLTQIKSFPSTIFLDRKGKVALTKAGFEGPGTGEHYEAMKKEFEETITKLLAK